MHATPEDDRVSTHKAVVAAAGAPTSVEMTMQPIKTRKTVDMRPPPDILAQWL